MWTKYALACSSFTSPRHHSFLSIYQYMGRPSFHKTGGQRKSGTYTSILLSVTQVDEKNCNALPIICKNCCLLPRIAQICLPTYNLLQNGFPPPLGKVVHSAINSPATDTAVSASLFEVEKKEANETKRGVFAGRKEGRKLRHHFRKCSLSLSLSLSLRVRILRLKSQSRHGRQHAQDIIAVSPPPSFPSLPSSISPQRGWLPHPNSEREFALFGAVGDFSSHELIYIR